LESNIKSITIVDADDRSNLLSYKAGRQHPFRSRVLGLLLIILLLLIP